MQPKKPNQERTNSGNKEKGQTRKIEVSDERPSQPSQKRGEETNKGPTITKPNCQNNARNTLKRVAEARAQKNKT